MASLVDMCRKRLLFIFLLIFFCSRAFPAAVFVVTSNADPGPPRDALTQAATNGSIEKDHFNLPDTSETINSANVVVQQMRCTDTATITGLQVPQGVGYYWTDYNGNVISTDLNLKVTKPGSYRLVLAGGKITSQWFQVVDDRVTIYSGYLMITDISCGVDNGSIKNLLINDPLSKISTVIWTDQNGKIVGNTADVSNLPVGAYILTITTSDGCTTTFGPVNLQYVTGPSINQTNVKIRSANCGQSTGSITNLVITGTGSLKYTWLNAQRQTVGTDTILVNQPPGTYILQVTDTQCGVANSTPFTISETNGISVDTSKVLITPSSCGKPNGSVVNLQVTGAITYQWTDVNGKTVATSADLNNVSAGEYTFTASNTYGCSLTKTYQVGQKPATPLPVYDVTYTTACYLKNNGGVTVAIDTLVKSARWVDSLGKTIGTGSSISNVAPGAYQLYLTDQNGCENYYKSYTINGAAQLSISHNGQPHGSMCGLSNGSITGVIVNGGVPPYTYTWTNANGAQIGSNSNSIDSLAIGDYKLTIADSQCGTISTTYSIADGTINIPTPSVPDIQLCSSGNALISVNNASDSAVYRLYESSISSQPLYEQKGGKFSINITGNSSFYVSEINGDCESSRAQVNVNVCISSASIANAFTPNGDGINDYWVINKIENYPNALVQIFNRYGQKVFESRGYATPFDGTYNGQRLPTGVYYYIINPDTKCNILSGSLTIIR